MHVRMQHLAIRLDLALMHHIFDQRITAIVDITKCRYKSLLR